MEKQHIIIIGLIVIILLLLAGITWSLTNQHINTVPLNNTTENNTNSSVLEATVSDSEYTPETESQVENSNNNPTDSNSNKKPADSSNNVETSYPEEEYEEEEVYDYSSYEDDNNYLSSDDYYVSDYGFVISKNPQNSW